MRGGLPWVVAAGSLALYLATLHPWLRLSSVPVVARVAGWDWHVYVNQPLLFLVTLPFHWVPEAWLPVALNAFTAVCAALTLGLLARSVALLPHDRLPAERMLERDENSLFSSPSAWIPPLLSVAVCGLGLSFWENATVASGAMLDLLVFAYAIRCLLEYRIDERQAWLSQAALVWGLGMANDWAMVAFLPLLGVALVWIKGLEFFKAAFLARMLGCGLLGFSLVLLPPVVQAFTPDSPVSFWASLGEVLGTPFQIIWGFASRFYNTNRLVMMLLGMVSLLPVLVMSIRWRSISADSSPAGSLLSKFFFHFAYVMLLLAGLWVALDPSFSPREIGARVGIGSPCLSLYYLSALSVGYFSGFVLLLASAKRPKFPRRESELAPFGRIVGRGLAWLVFLLIPAALVVRNLPLIRQANQSLLQDYARLSAQSLPRGGGIVLSDDPLRLFLVEAELAGQGRSREFVFLDTGGLPIAAYQAWLHRLYPRLWPEKPAKVRSLQPTEPIQLIAKLGALSETNGLYYLHPSFGYYFERFYPIQNGLTHRLHRFATQSLFLPAATAAEIDANQTFWRQTAAAAVQRAIDLGFGAGNPAPGFRTDLLKRLKIQPESNFEAMLVDNWYSAAADDWGVRLQRNGNLAEAGKCFSLARKLNPSNRAAELNLEVNGELVARKTPPLDFSVSLEQKLGGYRYVDQVLKFNGPLDDPMLCYALGILYYRSGLYRQSSQQLDRTATLEPNFLGPRLVLGNLYSVLQMADPLQQLVDHVRATPGLRPTNRADRIEVDVLEASAQLLKTNDVRANQILQKCLDASPGDFDLRRVTALYCAVQRYTNAFPLLDRRLRLDPNDVTALGAKGFLCLEVGAFSNALAPLTRVLALQSTNSEALWNRGVAYFRMGNLPAAESDYLALLKLDTNNFRVYYSLGEIAFQKKDTNAAVRYYHGCLSNSTPAVSEYQFAEARLKALGQKLR